jgi:hypothetical protein
MSASCLQPVIDDLQAEIKQLQVDISNLPPPSPGGGLSAGRWFLPEGEGFKTIDRDVQTLIPFSVPEATTNTDVVEVVDGVITFKESGYYQVNIMVAINTNSIANPTFQTFFERQTPSVIEPIANAFAFPQVGSFSSVIQNGIFYATAGETYNVLLLGGGSGMTTSFDIATGDYAGTTFAWVKLT